VVGVIEAARILGTQVGSTSAVFLTVLAVHVPAGLFAVAEGAVAAITPKGSARHVRAGRWYYRALCVVFATALVLAALRWRQDYQFALIGAVAFAAGSFGVWHRRRHRPGHGGHIAGMAGSYIAMLTAFYVDNGPHLPIWDRLPPLTFWFLPAVIGAPLTVRAIARHCRPHQPSAARPVAR
jgi:hypothetical protein